MAIIRQEQNTTTEPSRFRIESEAIMAAVAQQDLAIAEPTGNEDDITNPFSTIDAKTFDQWSTQQRRQEGAEQSGFAIVNQGPTNQETPEDRERQKDDAANDALGEMVETSQQSLKREREERLKAWQAQWDVAMSEEVEGLTNAEVLSSLKRINRNPRKAADDAVKRGDIRQEDVPAFMQYMKLWQENEEYKRNHNGESNPALVTQMKTIDDQSGGTIKPTAKTFVQDDAGLVKTHSAKITADARDGQQTLAIQNRDGVFDSAPLPGDPLKGSEKVGYATTAFAKVAPDTPPQADQKPTEQPQVTASLDRQASSTSRPSAAALSC